MTQTLRYRIHEVADYINWLYFFHAWGFQPRFAEIAGIHGCDACRAMWLARFPEADRQKAVEAMQLHKEAVRMLNRLDPFYHVVVRFALFPCNSDGDDLVIAATLPSSKNPPFVIAAPSPSSKDPLVATAAPSPSSENPPSGTVAPSPSSKDPLLAATVPDGSPSGCYRLPLLRQQRAEGECLCLADFLRPQNDAGQHDRIGIFAACADERIEHLYEPGTEDADDYRHLLCQTLADRLAEAAVERAHEEIRKRHWGYAPDEQLSIAELHAERFQGIRPAVGYPSLPDQSINFDLDRLIDFSAIGIRLTENGAMQPHAAVSGLMIAHPAARYFAVGRIGEDQLVDYARRKGRTPEEMRPFLAGNLG